MRGYLSQLQIPRPARCTSIEMPQETQMYNALPGGLPQPKELQAMNCRGVMKKPAGSGLLVGMCFSLAHSHFRSHT